MEFLIINLTEADLNLRLKDTLIIEENKDGSKIICLEISEEEFLIKLKEKRFIIDLNKYYCIIIIYESATFKDLFFEDIVLNNMYILFKLTFKNTIIGLLSIIERLLELENYPKVNNYKILNKNELFKKYS